MFEKANIILFGTNISKAKLVAGILLTLLTTSIFMKYNHTPVVKSSSRELSYTILIGTWQQLGPWLASKRN